MHSDNFLFFFFPRYLSARHLLVVFIRSPHVNCDGPVKRPSRLGHPRNRSMLYCQTVSMDGVVGVEEEEDEVVQESHSARPHGTVAPCGNFAEQIVQKVCSVVRANSD